MFDYRLRILCIRQNTYYHWPCFISDAHKGVYFTHIFICACTYKYIQIYVSMNPIKYVMYIISFYIPYIISL